MGETVSYFIQRYFHDEDIYAIDYMEDLQALADLIFEVGMLKRVTREGWKLIGVTKPENVASHSLRAAQIGYLLARLEGYENPLEVCTMLVFHDMGETRIGDIHKVAHRYVSDDESQAVHDQLEGLDDIGRDLFSLWTQVETKDTTAGILAKDADLLEMAATACEYRNQGFKGAEDWLENTSQRLITRSAKELFRTLRSRDPDEWWKELKLLDDD
jgi:putative hydrolase of HD superfamily